MTLLNHYSVPKKHLLKKGQLTLLILMAGMLILLSGCYTEVIEVAPSDPGNVSQTQSTCDEDLIPSSFERIYQMGFEDVRRRNRHSLTWDMPHWVEYAAMHREDGGKGNGLGGGNMWVESNKSHSGRKSLGVELTNIEKSRRAEFVIWPSQYLDKEYFVSYWLYIPGDFGLRDPKIDWDWLEFGNPFNSNGLPYSALWINTPDSKQEEFNLALGLRNRSGKLSTIGETRMKLPKNKWVHILYYVKRHKNKGEIKFWFDGQLIAEGSNLQTMSTSTDQFNISLVKIYHERGDKSAKRLWIDDLELYTPK